MSTTLATTDLDLAASPPLSHDRIVPPGGWDTDEGGHVGKTLGQLALVYVGKRQSSGHLNARSADQIRYRLLNFAAGVPANPKRCYRHHVERWPQLPKRLTTEEARRLVDAVRHDRRTFLSVLLMLQEGLRRVEISRLNVEDIDFAERSMTVRGKGGQGCETDALPITDETWLALNAYLADEGHQHGPLIRNRVRRHGRTAPATISELIRQGMVAAGVKRPGDLTRTPHSCRHSFAHDVLARTTDIRAVQQAMRHRSVRSTEVYLRGATTELRGVMEGRKYA